MQGDGPRADAEGQVELGVLGAEHEVHGGSLGGLKPADRWLSNPEGAPGAFTVPASLARIPKHLAAQVAGELGTMINPIAAGLLMPRSREFQRRSLCWIPVRTSWFPSEGVTNSVVASATFQGPYGNPDLLNRDEHSPDATVGLPDLLD